MMLSKLIPTIIFFGGASLLVADVQYEQTSKVTGGAMLNMPIVGARLKEPHTTKHVFKGNRMAMIAKETVSLYDLDKETVTTILTDKREYSVMTFAEMREVTDKMMQRMQQSTQKNDAEMTWAVKVTDSGESKDINGFSAKKYVVTVDGTTTEKKSGKAIGSRMEMDQWMAKDVPGAAEMNAFGKKMAEKLGAGRITGMSPMVQAQMGKGWYEAAKEFSKMEGFNVMTVTRMSTTIDGKPMMVPEGQQNAQMPSAGDIAKDAATTTATNEAASRAGRLAGLGGLGGSIGSGIGGMRRKKNADQPKPDGDVKMVPASSMENTMEVTSMSRAAADASVFEVPAGFKLVEAQMKKMAK